MALGVALGAMVVHVAIEASLALGRDPVPWAGPPSAVSIGLSLVAAVAVFVALRSVLLEQRHVLALVTQVRESEQRFSGIVSIAADAIVTIDERQSILLFNDGAEAIFGWSADEITGQPLSVLLPERVHEAHANHVNHFGRAPEVARRMGERQEIVGLRRDGTEFPAEASISRLELGDRRLFTVVLRDVTERRRQLLNERFLAGAGQTLSTSLDYESTLVSAVHIGIPHLADCCLLDLLTGQGTTRRIASVHDDPDRTRALRLLEHRQAPVSDAPFPIATVLGSGQRVRREDLPADWARASSGDPTTVEALEALEVRSYLTVPLAARGGISGTLTLLSTDRERALAPDDAVVDSVAKLIALAIDNAELYQTAQRATIARDEVLGVVSHDLRNPLSAIAMCARVLANDAQGATDTAELLDAIIQSTELMNHLIQDLLDVSVIDSGHLRIDARGQALEPLAERALEMLSAPAADQQVELRSVIPSPFPEVHVDETRFVQVLSNLLANAVKFSDAGGAVTLVAEADGGEARIGVVDVGTGIPSHQLPHLFDRHWHAKRAGRSGGTGLGLAIAHGIVAAHGGRIWVDSTEGLGSTFWFTVPVAGETGPASAPTRPAESPSHS